MLKLIRFIPVCLLLNTFTAFSANGSEPTAEDLNLSADSIAIEGYDPVAYFSGKALKGDESLALEHGGAVYRFASEKNRKAFEASPEKYLPQYGGWCAYAMLDSDKVAIDPETFKVVDGKLYLFYNGFWGDTLKKWNKKLSKQKESELIQKADANWTTSLDE